MKRLIVAMALGALLFAPQAFAKKKAKEDPLALARVLLLDGLPSRALAVLAQVDEAADPELDAKELYRLRGLAEHEVGLFRPAIQSLGRAIQLGESSAATWYALTNAHFGAEDWDGVIATLARAPKEIYATPGAHRLKAYAYYHLGQRHHAFEAVDVGFARFPAELALERLRVLLFLELGLSQDGLVAAAALLKRPGIGPEDHLTLAAALSSARERGQAALILEGALLRHPNDRSVREQLARVYYEDDRPLLAAQVMHPLSFDDEGAALLTAELYARAKKTDEALRVNGRVGDQKKKFKQRLAILIEAERFHEAAGLHGKVARLGLLDDEKQLYALAYAHYVSGDAERTEALLGQVSDPELFTKAVALRSALDACRSDVWKCD